MYGFRGLGQADQPDTFSTSELQALTPQTGPDASQVAPLQVGALAQSVAGQYSVNPTTGQLQQNVVTGIPNNSLLWIVGGGLGVVILLGAFSGGRRK